MYYFTFFLGEIGKVGPVGLLTFPSYSSAYESYPPELVEEGFEYEQRAGFNFGTSKLRTINYKHTGDVEDTCSDWLIGMQLEFEDGVQTPWIEPPASA